MKFTLGKIVSLAGLLVLLIGFFCPLACKKVESRSHRGEETESKTVSAIYFGLASKTESSSQSESKQNYSTLIDQMLPATVDEDGNKAGPVGGFDVFMGVVLIITVLGAIALEAVPGLKEKNAVLASVSRACFWISICVGMAIVAYAFQVTLFNIVNVNAYTVAGWIMLAGIAAALIGDSFDGLMAVVKGIAAKQIPATSVLAKPAAFIFALIGAGFVVSNMSIIRFAILPGALAAAAFGAVALAVLNKE